MRLTLIRSDCLDTESCPALYRTDRGTAVVRGYVVTGPEVMGTPIVAAVEAPFFLPAGLTVSVPALYITERGTVLVRGATITDPEALATLRLPIGEAAVEIHLSLPTSLPKQEVRT